MVTSASGRSAAAASKAPAPSSPAISGLASSIDRDVAPNEIETMRRIVRKFLPGADGPLRSAVVCMYTNTPDHHFFIDRHPAHPQVLIASPCSGHGFKFSSVIGEILCELLGERRSHFDLRLFRCRAVG